MFRKEKTKKKKRKTDELTPNYITPTNHRFSKIRFEIGLGKFIDI